MASVFVKAAARSASNGVSDRARSICLASGPAFGDDVVGRGSDLAGEVCATGVVERRKGRRL